MPFEQPNNGGNFMSKTTPTISQIFVLFSSGLILLGLSILLFCDRQKPTPLNAVVQSTFYEKGKMDLIIEPKININTGVLPLGGAQQLTHTKTPDKYKVVFKWLEPLEGCPTTYSFEGKDIFDKYRDRIGEKVSVSCHVTSNSKGKCLRIKCYSILKPPEPERAEGE